MESFGLPDFFGGLRQKCVCKMRLCVKFPCLTKHMAVFAAICWLFSPGAGMATTENLVPLHEPALQLRDPSNVLLINVAHAGTRLVAVGEHGVIIYSDDNGRSWHQALVPVQVTITTVAFATPKDGWAAGAYGVILHTTDGGINWKLQLTGLEVNQLIQQAAAQYSQANPQSPDALLAVRRASIFVAAGPDKPFLTIVPLSATNAIVLGGYRMCVRTADAGKIWADCSLNVQDPVSHNVYDAIQANGHIYAVGEAGDIFLADANGEVFKALNSPTQTTLFNILQTKTTALLAFGVADTMFRSTDGGDSWVRVKVPGGSDLTGGVQLKSGMIVVTSENGAVFGSNDDGQSFQLLSVDIGMAGFAVTQASNGNVIFVGSRGVSTVSADQLE